MPSNIETVRQVYERFNARDIDGILAVLADDVVWANGMDGGHVLGREAVRAYWTHQWSLISPVVEPLAIHETAGGAILVEVRQTIRDLDGTPIAAGAHGLATTIVHHRFHFSAGRISCFDIVGVEDGGTVHPSAA